MMFAKKSRKPKIYMKYQIIAPGSMVYLQCEKCIPKNTEAAYKFLVTSKLNLWRDMNKIQILDIYDT